MTDFQTIVVTRKPGLYIIRFNRPQKKNAINDVMYREFIRAMTEAADDETVGVTILTGTGDYYTSGNDFSGVLNSDMSDFSGSIRTASNLVKEFVSAFINHSKILVALVNGPCVGIGVTTLALCDLVYCTPNATFTTPFVQLGMTAEGCSTYTFPRIFGPAKSSELLYFGKPLSADDAVRYKFVNAICTTQEMETVLMPDLESLAQSLPIKSLVYSKQQVRDFDKTKLHEANRREFERLYERWTSEDFMNNIMNVFKKKSKL